MKQYQYRRHKRIFGSATAQRSLLGAVLVLLTALFPLRASAQYFRLSLEIPPKTGQTEANSFAFSQKSNINPAIESFGGNGLLCISSVENLQVLATLIHSDSLRNETGHAIPFIAKLAFRNDGQSQPPGTDAGNRASFPLSDCWRIIEYIEGHPQVLNAYIFIHVTASIPKFTKSAYSGVLNLIIEYN